MSFLDSVDVNLFKQFLSDQGIKWSESEGQFKVLYQGKKLPAIRYAPQDDVIIISFQSMFNDFGRIDYELDYIQFFSFYSMNEIDDFLLNIKSDYVKLIIKFFNLNPSIVKKAISKKSKKCKLRLSLKEKCAKLFLNGKE